ncbi:MAG: type 1 glutamine amidotransferase [Desulfobacterales bacterium]|jgi:protease I|nr:type 1 glutamine amidotransferase [Desulfobacterales bacterium]MDZ7597890.1 type 1 glutamine amidotransferase domain-containing protein [Desulfobacterales bacterium]
MELAGKKVLILVEQLYNEFEFWYPYYRLKEAGAGVTVVGSGSARVYTSKNGLPVTVDTAAENVAAAEYDGVIIPGGYAPDIMRRHAAMVGLVKTCAAAGKLVAAICHAGWMLASAEIVAGRTLTSFFSIRDDLVHAGARWVDREVVVDGNLVTSRTPEDLPAFMRAVIGALKSPSPALPAGGQNPK